MALHIFTLTSPLHDKKLVSTVTRAFLDTLTSDYVLHEDDFTAYGHVQPAVIFVRTGGTEGLFRTLLPELRAKTDGAPFVLLASATSNSLAASLEILSYLRQQGLRGEILHGETSYVGARIAALERAAQARAKLQGARYGVIGQPSDWLISSQADYEAVRRKLGVELVDIAMERLLKEYEATPEPSLSVSAPRPEVAQALPGAMRIYEALSRVVRDEALAGFTLRCFDLLTAVRNTGCMALAKLGAEGFTAGCEGDVPAMLSMAIVRMLLGTSSFQSNPASINPSTGELLMAHCTIPLDLVSRYELDTHFESGIGVGIRGYAEAGAVTLFKVSGDLSQCFAAEATLTQCTAAPNLCRTQFHLRLDHPADANYFLMRPIGNHHVVLPGRHAAELLQFCEALQG
ncbi:MAG: hypothetical protein J6N92_07660 [Alloprevotella sp.]|nr:hypothetical protein [Alloprevotella sp.]